MGQGSILLTIAWRNLWRNRTRTILTALTMGLGVAFCIFMNSWVGGFLKVMHEATVERNLGHLQIHHKDYPETMNPYDVVPNAGAVIDALRADPDIEVVAPRIQAFAMYAGADNEAASGSFVGVDVAAEAALTEMNKRVIDGRWLSAKGETVIGHTLADKLDLKVGGKLLVVVNSLDGSIGNQVYPVVGIYKVGTVERDAGAMFSLETAQELFVMGDGVHELVVLARSEHILAQVQERAQKDRADLAVRTWYEISPETKQMEDITLISSLVFVIIIMMLTGFMIINTLLMSVYERTRELGLLASMGLPPKSVMRLILIESGLLGLISSAVGLGLGLLGHLLLITKGIPMEVKEGEGFVLNGVVLDPVIHGHLDLIQVVIPLVVVIIVSLLAGIWPARRAVKLDPVTALAQE
jgi:ABC-type lipoprotein release transport system permease subunit